MNVYYGKFQKKFDSRTISGITLWTQSFKFLKWEKASEREKKPLILHGWESSMGQKIEEYENENYSLALVIGQAALSL